MRWPGRVVALETTLVAHGFPAGRGRRGRAAAERAVRAAGAVPATIGVLDGDVRVGLARRRSIASPAGRAARSGRATLPLAASRARSGRRPSAERSPPAAWPASTSSRPAAWAACTAAGASCRTSPRTSSSSRGRRCSSLLGRQVAARRARDRRGCSRRSAYPCSAGARRAAALLRRRRRPAGLGAGRDGRRGRRRRASALGTGAAAASWSARPPDDGLDAVEELIERGARRAREPGRPRPGRHAVRAGVLHGRAEDGRCR